MALPSLVFRVVQMIFCGWVSELLEDSELLEEEELLGASDEADEEGELGSEGAASHPPNTLLMDTANAVVPASFINLRRSIF